MSNYRPHLSPKGEQIADYVWLDQTQRSWHIWSGNPMCVSLQIVPLKTMTKKQIVGRAKQIMKIEKKRFAKNFPTVKWEAMK